MKRVQGYSLVYLYYVLQAFLFNDADAQIKIKILIHNLLISIGHQGLLLFNMQIPCLTFAQFLLTSRL